MRGVHVVGAATVVSSFLAEIEEVFDVRVPELQVRAQRTGALASLIYGNGDVIGDLQEGDDSGALAIRALDMGARSANCRPRATEAAGPLGEVREATPRFGDLLDGVAAVEQIAGGELGVQRAGVEECRGGGASPARLVDAVEFGRTHLAILFQDRQTHGHAEPENLRCFQTDSTVRDGIRVVDEVAVEEGLDADEVELEIGKRIEGVRQLGQIKRSEPGIETTQLDAARNVGQERATMGFFQRLRAFGHLPLQRLLIDVGQEDAGSKEARVGIDIEQRLGVEDDGIAAFEGAQVDRRAAQQPGEHLVVGERRGQADLGEGNACADIGQLGAGRQFELMARVVGRRSAQLAFGFPTGPIFSVGQRDVRLPDLDERLFDQVLKLLDVDEARPLPAHLELNLGLNLLPDGFFDPLSHAGRGDRTRNLVTQPGHHPRLAGGVGRQVAPDNLRKFAGFYGGHIVGERKRSRTDIHGRGTDGVGQCLNQMRGTVIPRWAWYLPLRSA